MTSLLTLPVPLVYNILDDLQPKDIFLTAYNVCSRLNSIIDSYYSHQVKTYILRINRISSLFFLFVVALKRLYLHISVFIQKLEVGANKWGIFTSRIFHTTFHAQIWSKRNSSWQIRFHYHTTWKQNYQMRGNLLNILSWFQDALLDKFLLRFLSFELSLSKTTNLVIDNISNWCLQ